MDSQYEAHSCPTTPSLMPRRQLNALMKAHSNSVSTNGFADINRSLNALQQKDCKEVEISKTNEKSLGLLTKLRNFFRTNFTKKEIILITILSFGNFCFGTAFSIQGPFFPSEAHNRGVEETWIGLIIGLGEIGFIPGSIAAGHLLNRIKSKHVLMVGLLSVGVANILFGALQWCYTPSKFIAFGIFLRLGMGLGMGAFFTACYNTIFLEFPDHVSRLYATVEMCYAVGMISGPAIGGVLNQFGSYFDSGFCLPFFLLGIFLLIAALITQFSIHSQKKFKNTEKTSVWQLLSKFGIVLNAVINFNAGALIGFNTTTLDLRLIEIANLSPSVKGVIFLISGITYAALNQIWGNLAEKMTNCYTISLFGCVSSLICFTFVGPIPVIPIEPQLWLTIVTQVFLGIGVGSSLVGSFVQGYHETIKSGFPESQSTTAIISGLFASSEALGTAAGPILGGFIMEKYGYRWSTVPIFVVQIVLISIIIMFLLIRRFKQNNILKVVKQIDRI